MILHDTVTTSVSLISVFGLAILGAAMVAHGAGTAFTYQGTLSEAGAPANGSYDLSFSLWDGPTGGCLISGPLTNPAVAVVKGVFITNMDFGAAVFGAGDLWLEVAVSSAGAGSFTVLSPRQAMTPAPTALYAAAAEHLTCAVTPENLPSCVVTNNSTAVSLSGVFCGSGVGLTNLTWSNSRNGLLAAAASGQFQRVKSISNAEGIVTNSLVLWPDGTYGMWSATNYNAVWLTVDGYTITYTNAGEIIAQPAVFRDDNGVVTNRPALVIVP